MPPVARIDYVELWHSSTAPMKTFYAKAFGWTFIDYGPDYAAFADVRDAGGVSAQPKRFEPLVILYADDLEAARKGVLDAGGEILGADHAFPGGRRFHFRDPGGNELAVWTKVES
jgi:predicted enzyme related to lactoylglutathione lyase